MYLFHSDNKYIPNVQFPINIKVFNVLIKANAGFLALSSNSYAVNVGLGDGQVGKFLRSYSDP